ncbi:hypothetical protein [Streptococcus lactarius]|uniref:Uncharacterized protein n=1 Tax=Streptococcus lactarius TaxID=684066 RepID=A0A9X1BC70_9STRE|nr:hypothetical protein [Streptococcus lactarius]MBK4778864.1 hypothetical protein [Streptococcus lactarius]
MLEVTQDFFDFKESIVRHTGDVFQVDEDRKNELLAKLPDFIKEYSIVPLTKLDEEVDDADE